MNIGSRSVPRTSRISQALARRASEPHASKSKLNRSQKEDKELEELSAFFSRKRPNDRAETREHSDADHGTHTPRAALDIESRYGPSGHGCSSSHGSQRSCRSDTRGVPRYPSSLPALKNHSSGRTPPGHPWIQQKSGSTWSQHSDNHNTMHESASFYSETAHSRDSTRAAARETLEQREKPKPALEAKAMIRSAESGWGVMRSTCKDAAAQTDWSPKAENMYTNQSQRLDGVHMTKNQHLGTRPHSSLVSPRTATQGDLQLLVGRETEEWSVSGLPRCLAHVKSGVEGHPLCQIQNRAISCDLLDSGQVPDKTGTGVGPLTHLGGPTRIFHHGYTGEKDIGSFSGTQTMPIEHMDCIDRQRDTNGAFHRTDYPGGIPGNFGLENLKEFIQRIEGEAEMPWERVEDGWTLPHEPGHQEQRQVVLAETVKFDEACDNVVMSSREWFPFETELLAPFPSAHSLVLPQEADKTCPTSPSMPGSIPVENRDGDLTAVWLRRDLF